MSVFCVEWDVTQTQSFMALCGACECCSPLHVAVVQEDLSLVQQILQTITELSAPVDCYNNLRQVCTLSCYFSLVIIIILTSEHHTFSLIIVLTFKFSASNHYEHDSLFWVFTSPIYAAVQVWLLFVFLSVSLRAKGNDWVKKCMEYEVEGARPRDRPKKTWREIVEKHCQLRELGGTGRMPWIVVDGWSR